MTPCIADMRSSPYPQLLTPTDLFGKDAAKLLEACEKAFSNSLLSGKYKGCYRSPTRPTEDAVNRSRAPGESFLHAYQRALAVWRASYPDEVSAEEESRQAWETQRDKQFRIIYGIARRHGLFIYWHGNSSCCCPDQWTVYRQGEAIARISCM